MTKAEIIKKFLTEEMKDMIECELGMPIKLVIDDRNKVVTIQGLRSGKSWDMDELFDLIMGGEKH
jgi:hypothetical protein